MSVRDYPLNRLTGAIDLLLVLGEYDAAEQTLAAMALVASRSSDYHLRSALLAEAQDRRVGAIKALRLAAGRDPLDAAIWQRLGNLLPEGAEKTTVLQRAALLNDTALADLRRGKPYLALGRITHFQEAHPDWPEWTILRAETLRRLDGERRARELLTPLMDEVPPVAPAFWLMAALSVDSPQIARELSRQVAGDDPAAASAWRLFAPDRPPLALPRTPFVPIPAELGQRLDELDELIPDAPALVTLQSSKTRSGRTAKGPGARAEPSPPDAPGDALHNVQQATKRLLGSSQGPLGDGATIALLVTRLAGLQAHAPGAVARIRQLAGDLAQALATRGVEAHLLIVDDVGSLAEYGNLPPPTGPGAPAVTEVVRGAIARLTARGKRLDAIVLLGGDEIVPFHRLPNPTTDSDQYVLSDNPYGCGEASALIPDAVVARLPDGGDDEGELLMTLLQRSIDFHHGWLSTPNPATFFPMFRRRRGALAAGSPISGWAASALAWQLPTQTVYNTLRSSEPLVVCPPAIGQPTTVTWPAQRLLYFNLHGVPGGPNWYGQAPDAPPNDPLPIALTPADVVPLHACSICVSEACFGAEIAGRTSHNALALRMLQANALAFVGSTVTAYGSVGLPLGGADVLVEYLLANLRRGHPVGRALLLARDGLARGAALGQGYVDPDDAKTLLSFVLYGDPWATPYARPVIEAKSILPLLTPNVARRRPVPLTMLPTQSIVAARHLIAKLVPYLREAPISADGQMSEVGQSLGNRVTKGPDGRNSLVFSAHSSFITSDGQTGSHVARLTLDSDRQHKLLVSR